MSVGNASIKVPFGSPVKCEYGKKVLPSGDSVGHFKFINRRGEKTSCDETLLNNIKSEVTVFGQKLTSFCVAPNLKQCCLAHYLTLIQHSKDFIHHNEEIHDNLGFQKDGSGVTLTDLEACGGSLDELQDFRNLAKQSAKEFGSKIAAYGSMRKNNSEANVAKRVNSNIEKHVVKRKKETVNDRETQELEDPDGLEQTYIKSHYCVTWLPIDSIEIDNNLVKVNPFRTYSIMNSIKKKYEPSLTTLTVCPKDENDRIDVSNLQNQKFVVVQKVHTFSAFLELDKTGEFQKLIGHKSREVLAWIIKTNSPAVTHLANVRCNGIENEFAQPFYPQDLLHIFSSLQAKDSSSNNLKTIERIAKHSRVGYNETTAILKLCKWTPETFTLLIKALELYEGFETLDVTSSGKYGKMLSEGKKLRLTNTLLIQLSKCSETHFSNEYNKLVKMEVSLKNIVEKYLEEVALKKTFSVLSQLAGFESVETICRNFPDKFSNDVMKNFIGADMIDGKKNQKCLELEKYFNDTKAAPDRQVEASVRLINIDSFSVLSSLVETHDTLIFHMASLQRDACMTIARSVLQSDKAYHLAILIFCSEVDQFEVLSFLRSQQVTMSSNLRIFPMTFHNEKAKTSDNIIDNAYTSLVFGRLSSLKSPLKLHYMNINQLSEVVQSIAPSSTKVAYIVDKNVQFIQVHGRELTFNIAYYGPKSEVDRFKNSLSKDKIMLESTDRPRLDTENNCSSSSVKPINDSVCDIGKNGNSNEYSCDENESTTSPQKSTPSADMNDSGFLEDNRNKSFPKKVVDFGEAYNFDIELEDSSSGLK